MGNRADGPSIVFVIGCPRSGTTLLQALLNRHPEIVLPPETKVFLDFEGRSYRSRLNCVSRIEADLGIRFRDRNDAANRWSTRKLLCESHSRFLKRVARENVLWVGDKTPEHTSKLASIRRIFPDAPVFAMVRNGVDVARSLSRVPWIRCDDATGAMIWKYYMSFITQAVDKRMPYFHVVKYENLIGQPTNELQRIFGLLNLSQDRAQFCLQPNAELDKTLFPLREQSWKGRAIEAISQTRMPEQWYEPNRVVQAMCGEMLARWGYSQGITLSRVETASVRLHALTSLARTLASLPASRLISEFPTALRQAMATSAAVFCGDTGSSNDQVARQQEIVVSHSIHSRKQPESSCSTLRIMNATDRPRSTSVVQGDVE